MKVCSRIALKFLQRIVPTSACDRIISPYISVEHESMILNNSSIGLKAFVKLSKIASSSVVCFERIFPPLKIKLDDSSSRGRGHGSPGRHGNGTGENGRWAYTGISWDSGLAGCPVGTGAEKPQDGAVGLELAGCPRESGAGLCPRTKKIAISGSGTLTPFFQKGYLGVNFLRSSI